MVNLLWSFALMVCVMLGFAFQPGLDSCQRFSVYALTLIMWPGSIKVHFIPGDLRPQTAQHSAWRAAWVLCIQEGVVTSPTKAHRADVPKLKLFICFGSFKNRAVWRVCVYGCCRSVPVWDRRDHRGAGPSGSSATPSSRAKNTSNQTALWRPLMWWDASSARAQLVPAIVWPDSGKRNTGKQCHEESL